MMIRLVAVILGLSLGLSSCGYHLGQATSSLKKSINDRGGILVKITNNQTLNRDLEPLLTRQIINSLEQQGIRTTDSATGPILAIALQSINYQALRSTDNNVLTASEYQTAIEVRWSVLEKGQSSLAGVTRGESTFFAGLTEQSLDAVTVQNSNFVQAAKQSYPQAILDLSEDLAAELAIGF